MLYLNVQASSSHVEEASNDKSNILENFRFSYKYLNKNISCSTLTDTGVSMRIHYPNGLPINRSEVQHLHCPGGCELKKGNKC